MSQTEAPASAPADTFEAVQALVDRAVLGDTTVLPELRRVLKAHPEMWQKLGDVADRARDSWLTLAAGKNLVFQDSMRLKAHELRAEIAGEKPSPLERLLVERVVATWLQVNYADAAYAQANKPGVFQSLLQEFAEAAGVGPAVAHLAAIKQPGRWSASY